MPTPVPSFRRISVWAVRLAWRQPVPLATVAVTVLIRIGLDVLKPWPMLVLVDHALGGPRYLRMIGSRRLSAELGDIVERVNTQRGHNFTLDYTYDAPGHPNNSYCRSDHYNYARYGIPIAYLGTSVQADYHMVTDEPQYIDYPGMARRASFMRDLALAIGNLDHPPVVDKDKPDPRAPCRQ